VFEAPNSVLQTALIPISSPNLTTVSYDTPSVDFPGYYAVLHFVELQSLSMNQSRQFDIYVNEWVWSSAAKPTYLKAKYVYDITPDQFNHTVFTLVQLSDSILLPILNGMEVYWPMNMEVGQLTSTNDGKKSCLSIVDTNLSFVILDLSKKILLELTNKDWYLSRLAWLFLHFKFEI
jgi:Malectin-like domain